MKLKIKERNKEHPYGGYTHAEVIASIRHEGQRTWHKDRHYKKTMSKIFTYQKKCSFANSFIKKTHITEKEWALYSNAMSDACPHGEYE